jgi:hypothetical protein
MAEKIVNGTFDTDLSGWGNIGARPFAWVAGMARGGSRATSELANSYRLAQGVSKYGSVISAALTVRIYYTSYEGSGGDGANTFTVSLQKPSGTIVELAFDEFIGAQDGNELICDALDISEHMTESGIYNLILDLDSESADDGGTFVISNGKYDDVSLVMVERLFASVTEVLGSGEAPKARADGNADEGMAMEETLTNTGAGGFAFNAMRLRETFSRALAVGKIEIAGLLETLTRTFGYRQRDVPGGTEVAGLYEYLEASFQEGNISRTRSLAGEEPTIWAPRIPVTIDYEGN